MGQRWEKFFLFYPKSWRNRSLLVSLKTAKILHFFSVLLNNSENFYQLAYNRVCNWELTKGKKEKERFVSLFLCPFCLSFHLEDLTFVTEKIEISSPLPLFKQTVSSILPGWPLFFRQSTPNWFLISYKSLRSSFCPKHIGGEGRSNHAFTSYTLWCLPISLSCASIIDTILIIF